MFRHLVIHHPKPEYVDEVLASMGRAAAAGQGVPGLVEMGPWRSTVDDRLIGFALWESEAAYAAGRDRVFAVVADDPFDVWLARPSEAFRTNLA